MKTIRMFSVTEARDQLHRLLKMAIGGENVMIINNANNQKFQIKIVEENIDKELTQLLKQFASSKLKSKSPEEIKKILETPEKTDDK